MFHFEVVRVCSFVCSMAGVLIFPPRKLNSNEKRFCSRPENFARPFNTSKLFEIIQILNE